MEVESPSGELTPITRPPVADAAATTPSTKGKTPRKKPSTNKKKTLKRKKEAVSGDDSSQEAGEYAVEKIVDKRILDGEVQYFIKWQGWPSESNTWEPIEHLGNCHLMIQAYESKLKGSNKKKTPGKRGRSSSVTSSIISPMVTGRGITRSKRGRKPNNPVDENFNVSEDELSSGVEDEDNDFNFGVMSECPSGKEIEKIHAVAVVDGYLTFLVQWKTKDNEGDLRPPLSDANSNMVRAVSLNEKFPQEVISYYQKNIRFNICLDPTEQGAIKAARARVQAEERKRAAALKKQTSRMHDDDDDAEDAATTAIINAERKYDRFDPMDSDLTTSSDEDLLEADDDDQEEKKD